MAQPVDEERRRPVHAAPNAIAFGVVVLWLGIGLRALVLLFGAGPRPRQTPSQAERATGHHPKSAATSNLVSGMPRRRSIPGGRRPEAD